MKTCLLIFIFLVPTSYCHTTERINPHINWKHIIPNDHLSVSGGITNNGGRFYLGYGLWGTDLYSLWGGSLGAQIGIRNDHKPIIGPKLTADFASIWFPPMLYTQVSLWTPISNGKISAVIEPQVGIAFFGIGCITLGYDFVLGTDIPTIHSSFKIQVGANIPFGY